MWTIATHGAGWSQAFSQPRGRALVSVQVDVCVLDGGGARLDHLRLEDHAPRALGRKQAKQEVWLKETRRSGNWVGPPVREAELAGGL